VLALGHGLAVSDASGRRRLLAAAAFPLAIDAVIALGRVELATLVGNLAATAATPRYHYAAPLGLALVAALVCVGAGRRHPRLAAAGPALALLVLGFDALAFARGTWRLDTHAWVRRETDALLATVERTARATAPGEPVVLPNARFAGVGPIPLLAPDVFPRAAGAFIAFHPADTVLGRPVRFVEADPQVYATFTADPDTRIARTLLPASPAR